MHFHRFMREVHARAARACTARAIRWRRRRATSRAKLRVLVLDEFFVTDIGDAMILARLLDGLFARGVTLVTTSNTAPPNLYQDGLQRARFLPAIACSKQHCDVLRDRLGARTTACAR